MRWLSVLLLLSSLVGCGPSEYERAKALLDVSESAKADVEAGIARCDENFKKFPKSEWEPDWQSTLDEMRDISEQHQKNIDEARRRLQELAK